MNIKINSFESRIEILRGLVAFIVIIHHLYSSHLIFDQNSSITDYIGDYNPPGHLSVLIFFILSGYVIGLSQKKQWETISDITSYCKKRALRIYPIFFISLLFTFIFIVPQFNWGIFLSNISFLSVPLDNVVQENNPIWSLHFEIIYYILFIPIAFYNIDSLKLFSFVAILALFLNLSSAYFNIPPLLLSYINGYSFWLGGLVIAKKTRKREISYSALACVSIFLLVFSMELLNPFQFFMSKLHLQINNYPGVSWYYKCIPAEDFYYLPYCFLLIFILSNREIKWFKLFVALIYLLPIIPLLPHLKNANWHIIFTHSNTVALSIWGISLALLLLSMVTSDFLKGKSMRLYKIGSVSYGVYIIHFPILTLIGGLGYVYEIKFLIYISCTILAAIVLERVIQPYIKKKISTT